MATRRASGLKWKQANTTCNFTVSGLCFPRIGEEVSVIAPAKNEPIGYATDSMNFEHCAFHHCKPEAGQQMNKQQRDAFASTLHEIAVFHSCAISFLESGKPEMVRSYIEKINAISYVGPNDYRKLPPTKPEAGVIQKTGDAANTEKEQLNG